MEPNNAPNAEEEEWWKCTETKDDAPLGMDSVAAAHLDAVTRKDSSNAMLATVCGLTFVFAIQYLIEVDSTAFNGGDRDSFDEHGFKAYLVFMTGSACSAGVGMWAAAVAMCFGAMLQAEYVKRGKMNKKEMEALDGFYDKLWPVRMFTVGCTCASMVGMAVAAFIYTIYKLDNEGKGWEFMSIPLSVGLFSMVLALGLSFFILFKWMDATGQGPDADKKKND